ncbi:MAG: SpoIID/LytB domain-containing protein [Planctomycetota bacterium]
MDVAPGPRGITLNGMATGATTLLVRPAGGFDLADTNYAGELRIHLRPGRVRFVNVVDLETYVAGVIPNEMAPGAGSAAYRAQAVAARTFAWIKIHEASAKARIFDVYDDQGSQVYTGRDPRYDVDAAAMVRYTASTAGVILTWKNQPFPAFYSSTCGGHTTDAKTSRLDPQGATGPLRGVRCGFCESSPRFRWKKTVSDAAVIQGMAARRRPIVAPVRAIEVTRKGPGGWAAQVRITYGPKAQTRTLPGTEFRSALRLDSHCVTSIRREGNAWVLEGRGWGHGVGMCQWGAMEMARRGFSESEILSWYYPGAAFVRVY